MSLTMAKESIMVLVEKSVMVVSTEAAFEVLNLTNYPLSPETLGTKSNKGALLKTLSADIKDLDTPFLKNVVTQSKALAKQGDVLKSIMSKEEMDYFIDFGEKQLGLSLSMLRATRTMIAAGEELGERAFMRQRYPAIRYQNFFQEHPLTAAKLMDTIRYSFYMAYMDGLEAVKVVSDAFGGKAPKKLNIVSGSMDDVLASGNPKVAMWQPYIRAGKCAGKAGLAGLLMPVVDQGITKFNVIHNVPYNR